MACWECAVRHIAQRYRLTPREVDVIALTLAGMGIRDISKTLRTHNSNVHIFLRGAYEKTGMENQLSLALWAIQRLREETEVRLYRGKVGSTREALP